MGLPLRFAVPIFAAACFGIVSCGEPPNTTRQLTVVNSDPDLGRVYLDGKELEYAVHAAAYFDPVTVRLRAEKRSPGLKGRFVRWNLQHYEDSYDPELSLVAGEDSAQAVAEFRWTSNRWPVWLEGDRLLFVSDRSGREAVYSVGADGSALGEVPGLPPGLASIVLACRWEASPLVAAEAEPESGGRRRFLVRAPAASDPGAWIDLDAVLAAPDRGSYSDAEVRGLEDGGVLAFSRRESERGGSVAAARFSPEGILVWRSAREPRSGRELAYHVAPDGSAAFVVESTTSGSISYNRSVGALNLTVGSYAPLDPSDFEAVDADSGTLFIPYDFACFLPDGRTALFALTERLPDGTCRVCLVAVPAAGTVRKAYLPGLRSFDLRPAPGGRLAATAEDGSWFEFSGDGWMSWDGGPLALVALPGEPARVPGPAYGRPGYVVSSYWRPELPTVSPSGAFEVERRTVDRIEELFVVPRAGGTALNVTYYESAEVAP